MTYTRRYGRYRDVDPKVRRFFPWALFLVAAGLLLLASCFKADAKEAPTWFCAQVKAYLSTHSEKEGRAVAAAKHVPDWLIKKAEACPK